MVKAEVGWNVAGGQDAIGDGVAVCAGKALLTRVVVCMMAPAIAMAPSSSMALAVHRHWLLFVIALKRADLLCAYPQGTLGIKKIAHMQDRATSMHY
jgi:hypothetical protein